MQANPRVARKNGVYSRRDNTDFGFRRVRGNVVWGFKSREAAIEAKAKDQLRAGAGLPPPDTKVTVSDLAQKLRETKRGVMRPRSFAEWSKRLDAIVESFGHLRPAQISADRVAQYRRELGQGRAAATVRKYETPLREVLALAVRRQAIPVNPYDLLTRDERGGASSSFEPRRWTAAELSAVLAAARELDGRREARQSYYPLVTFLIYTGARIGEALGLRWQDVDFLNGRVSISHSLGRDGVLGEPKTRAGARVFPLPASLERILLEAKPLDALESDCVFASRTGGPLGYWNARDRGIKLALAKAGITARVHDLRSAAASLLIDQGLTLVEVAGLLGHKDPTTTLRAYARWFGSEENLHAKARSAYDVLEVAE